MEKKRFVKTLSIIALVIAIAGMTLGFAAFSKVLTITSSAKVTPNSDDFKLVVYGATTAEEVVKATSRNPIDLTKWSTTEAFQVDKTGAFTNKHTATIDNSTLTISNISADFADGGISYGYGFAVKNEGYYDAKLSLTAETLAILASGNPVGKCTAGEGTDQAVVDTLCKKVLSYSTPIYDSEYNVITNDIAAGTYVLEVGDYILFNHTIENTLSTTLAEAGLNGSFTVTFPDLEIQFDSVA